MVFTSFNQNDPPNRGVRVDALSGEPMSQDGMFVRSHFPLPATPPAGFHVVIPGRARRFVTLDMLHSFDTVERGMMLECAGNGRAFLDPLPDGVPWKLGGVSSISVRGIRLADLLGSLPEDVVELVFTGADQGFVDGDGHIPYQFSIDRDLAVSTVPILATHIGGRSLNHEHGGPIRLIVPGHYAMKSVKWLTKVEGVTAPFEGHFVRQYRYYGDTLEEEGTPVGEIAVRSVISSPVDEDTTVAGRIEVRGSAWTASGDLSTVEVSVDGAETWHEADLIGKETAGRWRPVRWSVVVDVESGTVEIVARATDTDGNSQPLEQRWNAHGYANNMVHRINVQVLEPPTEPTVAQRPG